MQRKAFTLIELLVVIAIIAVLMGILMPALRKVREQARQKSCATRVRQMVLACVMYGDDNDTILPRPSGVGYWLQDVTINQVHYMLDTGMTQEMFYCPSSGNYKNLEALWTFNNNSWDGHRFTNYGVGSYIVSGYLFITQLAPDAPQQREKITKYARDPVEPIWLETTQEKQPALRDLVVDNTIGQNANDTKYGFNFGRVAGGLLAQGIYDQTSHLKNDFEPSGHNNGYLDGHVTWYNFDPPLTNSGDAIPRYTFGQNFFW